jgi:hypothetical protein
MDALLYKGQTQNQLSTMNYKNFAQTQSAHIIDVQAKKEYERQLDELETLDEKSKYYAEGVIDSAFIFYAEIEIICDTFPETDADQAWVFRGQAGGLIGLAATLTGDVRTADLQKMLRETRRFQVCCNNFEKSVNFSLNKLTI